METNAGNKRIGQIALARTCLAYNQQKMAKNICCSSAFVQQGNALPNISSNNEIFELL